jgi:hypothetical protein
MGKLAELLADPKGKDGWSQQFAEPASLFYAMYRLRDCLEAEYTGPAGTRPLWAEFLDEAAGVLAATDAPADAGRWREAAVEIRASGEQWSLLVADTLAAHPAFDAYGLLASARRRLGREQGGTTEPVVADATERVSQLSAMYAADPLSPPQLRSLLDRLAERVRAAREHEQRAVELLS